MPEVQEQELVEMTIEELREKLILAENESRVGPGDFEAIHSLQDKLLIEFIDDSDVTAVFNRTTKWYA